MNSDEQLDLEAPETEELEDGEVSGDPLEGREDLQQELLKLYQKCVSEDRWARLIEVRDVWQAERYWQGQQYGWWSRNDNRWYAPGQGPRASYNYEEDTPRFQFVTNIYQARGLNVVGAIAGAPPRVRFFPDDADDVNDLETAEGRSKLAKLIQRWNPPQKLLQEEAYHAWTGGFIAWRTRYVEDGDSFGFDSAPSLESEDMETGGEISCPQCGWQAPAEQAEPPVPCPQCGQQLTQENISEGAPIPVPVEGEEQNTPRGREIISVWGALNCKRPQHVNHQSEYHYFSIEREVHYCNLREKFPDIADKIQPGMTYGPDDAYERNARLAVSENAGMLAQGGNEQAVLCTYAEVWFRPRAFYALKKEVRDVLLEMFPSGCRVEFCGSQYCASESEALDDALVTASAMPGRGQHRQAIGSSTISVQDRLNTLANIAIETYEYGIPRTYLASDMFSVDDETEQRSAPGTDIEVALAPGNRIADRIMQVRADSVSSDMAAHMQELFGPVSQDLSGAYPAVSGTTENQPDTLGQQVMQRDQAMGRMGVFYVNLKQAHADVLTIACRDYESRTQQTSVKIPVFGASGDFESESVDITALQGEARAYPEGDENFPELWNQKRATMTQVADSAFGPELMKEPENAELFAKLTGIDELKVPGVDARRKQLKEIAELTKIPSGDELLAGIAPMVEVDPEADDHGIEAATCKSWLNSEAGQKIKRNNPMGWQAVKEHMLKHQASIPKPAPPEKPLAESLNVAFKDMPPEGQAQVLEKLGIHVSPQDFIQAIAFEQAKKAPKVLPGSPGAPPPPSGAIQ